MKKRTQIILIILMSLATVSVYAGQYYKLVYYHPNVAVDEINGKKVALPERCGVIKKLYVSHSYGTSGTMAFEIRGQTTRDYESTGFPIYPETAGLGIIQDDVPICYGLEDRVVTSMLTNTGEVSSSYRVEMLIEAIPCFSTSG